MWEKDCLEATFNTRNNKHIIGEVAAAELLSPSYHMREGVGDFSYEIFFGIIVNTEHCYDIMGWIECSVVNFVSPNIAKTCCAMLTIIKKC